MFLTGRNYFSVRKNWHLFTVYETKDVLSICDKKETDSLYTFFVLNINSVWFNIAKYK